MLPALWSTGGMNSLATGAPELCSQMHVSGKTSFPANYAHPQLEGRSSPTPNEPKFEGMSPCDSINVESGNWKVAVRDVGARSVYTGNPSSRCPRAELPNSGVREKSCKVPEKRCELGHLELRRPSSRCPSFPKISRTAEFTISKLRLGNSECPWVRGTVE